METPKFRKNPQISQKGFYALKRRFFRRVDKEKYRKRAMGTVLSHFTRHRMWQKSSRQKNKTYKTSQKSLVRVRSHTYGLCLTITCCLRLLLIITPTTVVQTAAIAAPHRKSCCISIILTSGSRVVRFVYGCCRVGHRTFARAAVGPVSATVFVCLTTFNGNTCKSQLYFVEI